MTELIGATALSKCDVKEEVKSVLIYSRDCRIINNDRFYVHISTEVSVVVLLEHVAQILPGKQCNWDSS